MPKRRQSSNQMPRTGTLRIGTRHLGSLSVRGRRRVPSPAASRKAFTQSSWISGEASLSGLHKANRDKRPTRAALLIAINKGIVNDGLCSLEVETQSHFVNALGGHRVSHSLLTRR